MTKEESNPTTWNEAYANRVFPAEPLLEPMVMKLERLLQDVFDLTGEGEDCTESMGNFEAALKVTKDEQLKKTMPAEDNRRTQSGQYRPQKRPAQAADDQGHRHPQSLQDRFLRGEKIKSRQYTGAA